MKTTTEKFIMKSDEFGYDIFIAPATLSQINVTDKKEEAEVWSHRDTQSVKLSYYRKVTGLNLKFVQI